MRLVFFILTAALQQRRQYIPQGWSKYYEFGEADLKAALGILGWMDNQFSSGRCDWTLLQRLSEALAFGGRINNQRDLDILRNYLTQFCCSDVLSSRWSPLGLSISLPTSGQLQDYYNALNKLPDMDEPSMYGLAHQAQQQREIEQARRVIKELRGLHFGGTPALDVLTNVRQKLEQQIKPLLSFWRKLAGSCTIAQTAKEAANVLGESPWSLFVLAELQLGFNLYGLVHQTLSQMHGWLKEAQDVDNHTLLALAEQQIPASWLKLWPGPSSNSVVDYLRAVMVRLQAAEQRFKEQLHLQFGEEINLIHVFNCENLLACLKLLQARIFGVSVERLELLTCGPGTGDGENKQAIILKWAPLKLDGAKSGQDKSQPFYITYKTIKENSSEFNISTNLSKYGNDVPSNKNKLKLPLYTRASRDKLICYLDVNQMEGTDEQILLAGTALIVEDY